MTIEQTVDIPPNHRLTIDVPREVPAGRAQVIINFPASGFPPEGLCLNTAAFENPPGKPLEPLLGIAEGSAFTVERLLEERRREDNAF